MANSVFANIHISEENIRDGVPVNKLDDNNIVGKKYTNIQEFVCLGFIGYLMPNPFLYK